MHWELVSMLYQQFMSVVLESMKRENAQIVGESRRENKAVEKALQKKANKRYS